MYKKISVSIDKKAYNLCLSITIYVADYSHHKHFEKTTNIKENFMNFVVTTVFDIITDFVKYLKCVKNSYVTFP